MGESGRVGPGRGERSGVASRFPWPRRQLRAITARSTAPSARLRNAPAATMIRSTATSSPLRPATIISSTTESTSATRPRQVEDRTHSQPGSRCRTANPAPAPSRAAHVSVITDRGGPAYRDRRRYRGTARSGGRSNQDPRRRPGDREHKRPLLTRSAAMPRRPRTQEAAADRIPGPTREIASEGASRTGIGGRAPETEQSRGRGYRDTQTCPSHFVIRDPRTVALPMPIPKPLSDNAAPHRVHRFAGSR